MNGHISFDPITRSILEQFYIQYYLMYGEENGDGF